MLKKKKEERKKQIERESEEEEKEGSTPRQKQYRVFWQENWTRRWWHVNGIGREGLLGKTQNMCCYMHASAFCSCIRLFFSKPMTTTTAKFVSCRKEIKKGNRLVYSFTTTTNITHHHHHHHHQQHLYFIQKAG